MKLATLLSMFFMAASAFAQSSIMFTWTSNGNPGIPACSATVTASCIVGMTISDITTPAAPLILSSSIAPMALTFTYVLLPLTAASNRNFSLVTNAKDSNGNSEASSASTATVSVPSIPPNSPVGFSAVVVQ